MKIQTAALLALLAITNKQADAQELKDVAQWCYAATDVLVGEAGSMSEYGVMRNHLAKWLPQKFGVSTTEAKINGMSQLKGAARKTGVTVEKMSLQFYNQICEPVFVV